MRLSRPNQTVVSHKSIEKGSRPPGRRRRHRAQHPPVLSNFSKGASILSLNANQSGQGIRAAFRRPLRSWSRTVQVANNLCKSPHGSLSTAMLAMPISGKASSLVLVVASSPRLRPEFRDYGTDLFINLQGSPRNALGYTPFASSHPSQVHLPGEGKLV